MDESDTVSESGGCGGGVGIRKMRQIDVINSFLDQFNTEEYEARLIDDFEVIKLTIDCDTQRASFKRITIIISN